MNKPLIVLGGGGHSKVLSDILLSTSSRILAIVSPDPLDPSHPLAYIERLEKDEEVLTRFTPGEVELVNGLGSLPGNEARRRLYDYFSLRHFRFALVVSPRAVVSGYASLGEGVQVMPGAIVQASADIGRNSIINSGAIIEHDCHIGEHNHVAPGATLSGGVITASGVHVGTGANIVQSVRIGENAVIGAGATIVKDVPARCVLIPARTRELN